MNFKRLLATISKSEITKDIIIVDTITSLALLNNSGQVGQVTWFISSS
jgi:hypothetical protein